MGSLAAVPSLGMNPEVADCTFTIGTPMGAVCRDAVVDDAKVAPASEFLNAGIIGWPPPLAAVVSFGSYLFMASSHMLDRDAGRPIGAADVFNAMRQAMYMATKMVVAQCMSNDKLVGSSTERCFLFCCLLDWISAVYIPF